MKLAQMIVEYSKIIGLHELPSEQQRKLNYRNVIILLLFVMSLISATAFIFYDANTPREYAEAFFPWASLLFMCIGYLFNTLQITDLFTLKNNVERSIEVYLSDDRVMTYQFEQRNKTINQWTKLLHNLFFKGIFPIIVISV